MITIKTGLEGRFNIQVLRNNIVVQETEFLNTITNNGLDMFGTMYPLNYCNVGIGVLTGDLTGATSLNSFAFNVAGGSAPSSTVTRSSSSPYYVERILYWRKDSISSNYNLTEISVGNSNTNTQIFSLCTIKDGVGTPTTITVLAGDSLQVTYKIRAYANETPITGIIAANQDLVEQAFTIVPNFPNWDISVSAYIGSSFNCYTSTSAFNPSITVDVSGSSSGTATWSTYTNGDYYRDATIALGVSSSNIGTITQIITSGSGVRVPNPIKIGLTPGFVKNSSYIASFSLRFSWARYV